jgi:DNA-binding transcriptional MocR family regulator
MAIAPQISTEIQNSPSQLPQPHIDLQKGWPTPRLLPSQLLRAAAEATLSNPKRATEAMLYGPNIGDPALRRGCAEWLSRLYRLQPPVTSERICITAGASGNLACIMAAFTDPVYTRRVWMVEPTYFLACTVFDDAGFLGRLVGCPEDEDGLDVELLRRRIEAVDREEEERTSGQQASPYKRLPQYPRLYRHVIYLVPTFSNPSAKTYTRERREALVRLARDVNALVITDDCYDFLSWTVDPSPTSAPAHPVSNGISHLSAPTPPPRIVDVDRSLPGGDQEWGNAVSNGSFSKVMGPGLRCGWAEATPNFIARLNRV